MYVEDFYSFVIFPVGELGRDFRSPAHTEMKCFEKGTGFLIVEIAASSVYKETEVLLVNQHLWLKPLNKLKIIFLDLLFCVIS